MAIEITETTRAIKNGILGALDDPAKKAAVILRRAGSVQREYVATDNTNAGRMGALALALGDALDGDRIELVTGDFAVAAGSPLADFCSLTKVKLTFGEGAALLYADPEDTESDWPFFTSPLYGKHFGMREKNADGTLFDNWKPLQALMNACPPRPGNLLLASGRKLKNGARMLLPQGEFWRSRNWQVSPFSWIESESGGVNSVNLQIMDGTYTDPDNPVFNIQMEEAALDGNGVPVFSKNNCFGARLIGINLIQTTRAANAGLAAVYWYGAQITLIDQCTFANHALHGLSLYGGMLGLVWINNMGRGGIDWTGGGAATLLSVERCGAAYPWIKVHDGTFDFQFIQSEDSPPLTPSITLLQANNVAGMTVGTIYLGCTGNDTRTHTLVKLRDNCHNIHISSLLCFPNTVQTLVDDASQQSPNGPGVEYKLMGNTGHYDQISGGKPGGRTVGNTWTGLNFFTKQTVFGTTDTKVSFLFQSDTGTLDLGDGKIECSRSIFYINAAVPKEMNVNLGKFTVSATGSTYAAGGFNVQSIDGDPEVGDIPAGFRKTVYNFDVGEIRDWVNIGGTLYKSAPYTAA